MREITQTESTSTIKKKDARITWVRTEILFLFASFGLPYLMGLFFYLTTRYSLLDIFSHEKVIRYALLGVVFFFTFTFFSWYLHYRKAEVFLHKSTKWISGLCERNCHISGHLGACPRGHGYGACLL